MSKSNTELVKQIEAYGLKNKLQDLARKEEAKALNTCTNLKTE